MCYKKTEFNYIDKEEKYGSSKILLLWPFLNVSIETNCQKQQKDEFLLLVIVISNYWPQTALSRPIDVFFNLGAMSHLNPFFENLTLTFDLDLQKKHPICGQLFSFLPILGRNWPLTLTFGQGRWHLCHRVCLNGLYLGTKYEVSRWNRIWDMAYCSILFSFLSSMFSSISLLKKFFLCFLCVLDPGDHFMKSRPASSVWRRIL